MAKADPETSVWEAGKRYGRALLSWAVEALSGAVLCLVAKGYGDENLCLITYNLANLLALLVAVRFHLIGASQGKSMDVSSGGPGL